MIQYGVYRLEGRHGKEKKELTGRQQESLCELESKHRREKNEMMTKQTKQSFEMKLRQDRQLEELMQRQKEERESREREKNTRISKYVDLLKTPGIPTGIDMAKRLTQETECPVCLLEQFFTRKSAKSVGRVLSSRMQRANYVPARKGGRHLRDEQGMIYSLSKRRENKSYYFCSEKKNLSCPATAVVENSTDMIIKISGDHAHDSNILQHNEVVPLRERVNQMLDDLHQSMDKEDNDLRGSWNTELERSHRHRQANRRH